MLCPLGRRFLRSGAFCYHVSKEHDFDDKDLFYRLKRDDCNLVTNDDPMSSLGAVTNMDTFAAHLVASLKSLLAKQASC